ncbi:hypothetical protein AW736_02500 [Termitidicoccus mucosus]|uniref:Uncharacterized protein n=1 Tax=Termitidicoccus mucosus TaxID=1184151 RepID=A0A178IP78_9BACT|nr:hypothetical protein AW736_02500 [Opitutaceae bacterium TSB47]
MPFGCCAVTPTGATTQPCSKASNSSSRNGFSLARAVIRPDDKTGAGASGPPPGLPDDSVYKNDMPAFRAKNTKASCIDMDARIKSSAGSIRNRRFNSSAETGAPPESSDAEIAGSDDEREGATAAARPNASPASPPPPGAPPENPESGAGKPDGAPSTRTSETGDASPRVSRPENCHWPRASRSAVNKPFRSISKTRPSTDKINFAPGP